MWQRRLAVVLPIVVAAGLIWWWRQGPSDRQQIGALIGKVVHGIETKSMSEVMGCVAPDYRDPEGMSHGDVARTVLEWSRGGAQADIVLDNYEINITPPTATGVFSVHVLLEEQGETAGLDLNLTVQFEKQRRRWRRVWLVKSVSGYEPERVWGDML